MCQLRILHGCINPSTTDSQSVAPLQEVYQLLRGDQTVRIVTTRAMFNGKQLYIFELSNWSGSARHKSDYTFPCPCDFGQFGSLFTDRWIIGLYDPICVITSDQQTAEPPITPTYSAARNLELFVRRNINRHCWRHFLNNSGSLKKTKNRMSRVLRHNSSFC